MSKNDFYNTLVKIAGEDAAKEIAGCRLGTDNGSAAQSRNVKTSIQRNELANKTTNPINTVIQQPSPYRSTSFRV